ncbi:868_t:CDS:2, partial [Entrophospora sp. SA101]
NKHGGIGHKSLKNDQHNQHITKYIRQKELVRGYVTDSDGNESEFEDM